MAKTAKVKKRQVAIHSRAARRVASPSIDLDKNTRPARYQRDSASPSRPSKTNPHALAAKSAGIQKKQKKGTMSRAQRLRHQKGLERAEENLDKLVTKREKSFGKEKKVRERAKGWEDVNGAKAKKQKLETDIENADLDIEHQQINWAGDEEMDGNDLSASNEDAVNGNDKETKVLMPESIPLPVEADELL